MTDYYDDSIYEQPETPRQEQEASHQEPEQSMPQMPHTPKKEKKNGKGAVALVLCCALVGGGCGIGGADYLSGRFQLSAGIPCVGGTCGQADPGKAWTDSGD